VNSTTFGKLFTVSVDGSVYAQTLYIPNVSLSSGTHNVLYVATQHDSIYAIDADTGTIYWQVSLIPTGGSTVNSSTDLSCGDIPTEVGITGTPVIDTTTNTLYVVAKSKVSGTIYQYLHALDIGSGAEKFGGPVNIAATYPGTASDGNGTTLTFSARQENQRAALLLENGHVIVSWASHCDKSPWHGWVISYAASTLAKEAVYNSSPSGYASGIWMSGSGPAADSSGNIYASTGNGSWNTSDRGDTVLKLAPPANSTFAVADYFTPYNQAALTSGDTDLSAGGIILLPTLASGKQLLTTLGKSGTMYLLDRTNLGKYCPDLTPACSGADTNVVQEVPGAFSGYWGVPAYWNGNVYFGGGNDNTGEAEPIRAFSFNAGNSGLLSTAPRRLARRRSASRGPTPRSPRTARPTAFSGASTTRIGTPAVPTARPAKCFTPTTPPIWPPCCTPAARQPTIGTSQAPASNSPRPPSPTAKYTWAASKLFPRSDFWPALRPLRQHPRFHHRVELIRRPASR
jgi:hypothetical protein